MGWYFANGLLQRVDGKVGRWVWAGGTDGGRGQGPTSILRHQVGQLMAYLEEVNPTPIHGYGAAQILPVLAYHMGTDLLS